MVKASIFLLPIFIFAFTSCKGSAKQNTQSPNVVMILVDDMGWTDLGCYGSDYYQTPNIDQLAEEGVRFTNAYSSCTVCSPSRASVMTGKYPARLNLTDWIEGHKYPWAKLKVPDWKMYLDSSEVTMAEAFRQAGYYTAHVGKWHLGEEEKDWPENHGFDVNIGGWSKGAPHRNKQKGFQGYFSPYGNPRLKDGEDGEYLTDRLAGEVCEIIDREAGNPFFINFWLYNVHMPLQARQEKIEKYKALQDSGLRHHNPVYAAMVEHTDDAVGKVIGKLKEKGLYENTIILFSSDNGGLIGRGKRKVTSNSPLRDGKGSIYEGGVRVPTILYSAEIEEPGRVIATPVISNDYYPTLMDFAAVQIPQKQQAEMDGASWVPLLQGETDLPRKALFWHYPHYHQEGAVPYSAVRMGPWKLIHNYETGMKELYNLHEDVGESTNLVESFPEKVRELETALDTWKSSVDAQMPVSNDDYDPLRERKKNRK